MDFDLLIRRYLAVRSSTQGRYDATTGSIYYISDITGTPQLWRTCMEADGRHDLVLPWDQRIGDYRISPEGYIAFTSDVDGDEKWSLYLYTGDKLTLISGGDGSINLLGSWSPDGRMLAYTSNKANNVDFDLYVYDTLNGQSRRVAEGVGMNFAEAWVDGRILVVRRNTNLDSDILLVDPKTGREELLTPHEGEAVNRNPTPLDGGWVAFISNEGSEFTGIRAVNIRTREYRSLYEPGWDVEHIAYKDGILYFTVNEGGSSALYKSVLEDLRPKVLGSYKGKWVISLVDPLPRGEGAVVSISSPLEGSEVYLLRLGLERVTYSPKLGLEGRLVEPRDFYYESFDGLRIHGLIYIPRRLQGSKRLPGVIWLHGGPESQVRPQFHILQQAIAGLGVAVAAPNFRGSTGYGKTFIHLDDVEKRLDAVKDVYYAVKYLTEAGILDPDRICVMGGSYGGYLTLMSLAMYPDIWRCGVEIVGIVNLVTFIRNTSPYRRRYRIPEYGDPERHYEIMMELSPITHAHKIRAPLMIVHGARDPRVPVSEAEQIVEALRGKGVPVEYIRLEDEGHGIVKISNRLRVYSQVLKFLSKHLLEATED